MPPVTWDSERTETLKQLYYAGVRMRDIYDQMALTEDQVRGKIRTMILNGSWEKRPPTIKSSEPKPIKLFYKSNSGLMKARKNRLEVEKLTPRFRSAADALNHLRLDQCRWPIGDPRAKGFRFCANSPLVPGKPYCTKCCKKAYSGRERATTYYKDAA